MNEEEFKPFFITELKQIEALYIPKLEGTKKDFIFEFEDPFEFISSPRITGLRKPLINCLKCWRYFIYGNGEEFEKEYFPCEEYRKGDSYSFNYNEIPNYISDNDFKNSVKRYIAYLSTSYYERFEESLSEISADANQKKFISKIIDISQNAIMKILDLELNKYNRLVAGELIRGYILFIEKIVNENEIFFPEFIIRFESKIENLRVLFENNFGFINELDNYIYRDYQTTFLEYEKQLFPKFLTSDKIWRGTKNDLVRYYLFLENLNIFKDATNKAHLKILRFLAERYSTALKKQTDPRRIAKLSPGSLFDFLK
ncbi:hypothetical protein JM83_1784 [Gillisia sp. Hel_I_86]|uniref:hypothetical protein n=1 Tax=Gillisia sp. Hel_I_86 TaxID=1249981 RepID=UPI001199D118|nr:hypothetical protein [Gillisia sp. Hel_I_86]TVZ26794.1 hypothetical protein JM83_1784 [Gillisia sp. Hel_I_86]